MLDTLLRNIVYGTTYYALEHIGANQDACINILIAKKKKGELTVVDKTKVFEIDEVREFNKKLKSAHLIINNNQVLQKTIDNIQTLSEVVLINQAFPNIDLNAFYHQIIRVREKAYVYICRKEYVDTLIQKYEDQTIYITQWSIGNTPIAALLPLLKKESIIQTPQSAIFIDNGAIRSIDRIETGNYQNEYYDVEGIKVEGSYINALGAIVATLGGVSKDIVSTNFEEKEIDLQSYFKQHRLFAIGLPVAIGILLLIFLVNFLFYNHYYTKVNYLNEIGGSNVLQKELLIKKDSIVDQKQKLFEDLIASASSSSSYFIDRVIGEMPSTILLDQLQYHPLVKKPRKNKPIIVQENTLVIHGETTMNNDLSEWISTLEELDFIESVSIGNLEKKGKNTAFSIEILMHS